MALHLEWCSAGKWSDPAGEQPQGSWLKSAKYSGSISTFNYYVSYLGKKMYSYKSCNNEAGPDDSLEHEKHMVKKWKKKSKSWWINWDLSEGHAGCYRELKIILWVTD